MMVPVKNEKEFYKIYNKIKDIGSDDYYYASCPAAIRVKQDLQGEIFGEKVNSILNAGKFYAMIEGDRDLIVGLQGTEFCHDKFFKSIEKDGEDYFSLDHYENEYLEHWPVVTKEDLKKFEKAINAKRDVQESIPIFDEDVNRKPSQPKTAKEISAAINAKRLDDIEKNVPPEMRALPNWCPFKTFYNAEEKKTKKFVLNIKDGSWAKFNDPTTWTTFENAIAWARVNGGAGVSFAMKGSGLNCIDLDKCYNKETKEYSELGKKLLAELSGTYAERSVSGTGLHFFLKDQILENGKYKNRNQADKPDIEVFEEWGFVSMTGNKIFNTNQLAACPAPTKKFIQDSVGHKEQPKAIAHNTSMSNKSDNEVLDRIRKSKKATEFEALYNRGEDLCGDRSRTDLKLMNMLAFFSGGDVSQVERIFEGSALYRPEKGTNYVQYSAKRAVETLRTK
jgi:hypothetical protein